MERRLGALSPFTPDVHYPGDTNLALCVRQPQAQRQGEWEGDGNLALAGSFLVL